MNDPNYKPPRAINNVTQDAYNYAFLTELSYEKWLLTAKNLFKNAQQKQRSGLNPEAYVSYLRFIDLMINKIPSHPDFKDRSSYRTLKNIALSLNDILDNLKIAVIKERDDYIAKRKQERLKKRQKELSVIMEVDKPLESDSVLQNSTSKYKEAMTETSENFKTEKELGYDDENKREKNIIELEKTEPLTNSKLGTTLKNEKSNEPVNTSSIFRAVEQERRSPILENELDNHPFAEQTLPNDITKDKESNNRANSLSTATSVGSLIQDINDDYSISNSSRELEKLEPHITERLTLDPRSLHITSLSCQPTILKNYSKNRNNINGTGIRIENSNENEITVNPFSEVSEESIRYNETLSKCLTYDSEQKTVHIQSTNPKVTEIKQINKSVENDLEVEPKNDQEKKIYTIPDVSGAASLPAYATNLDDNRYSSNFHQVDNNGSFEPDTLNSLLSSPYKGMDFNTESKYKVESVSFINTPINDRGFRVRSSEPLSPLKVNNADKMNSFIFDDYDNQTIDKDMEIMSIPIYPNEMKEFQNLEVNKESSKNVMPDVESDVEQVFDKNDGNSSSEDINEEYIENNIITEDENSINSKTQIQLVKTPHMYKGDDIKFSNSPISILSPLKPPKIKSFDEIEQAKNLEKNLEGPIPMERFENLDLSHHEKSDLNSKIVLDFPNIADSKRPIIQPNEPSSESKVNVTETSNLKNSLLSPFATDKSAPSVYSSAKSLVIPTKPTMTNLENSSVSKSSNSKAEYLCSSVLQKVYFPKKVKHKFMNFVKRNTFANLETCGLLCGKLSEINNIVITDILIPDQKISSNCCKIINEHNLIKYIDNNNLYIIGWIHTHPRQACFLSSIDLHTQFVYQQLLPEAIAVVIAPESNPSMGIFRLSRDIGMNTIQNCEESGFHKHNIKHGAPLYVDCLNETDQNVIVSSSLPVSMTDIREYEYIIKGPKK